MQTKLKNVLTYLTMDRVREICVQYDVDATSPLQAGKELSDKGVSHDDVLALLTDEELSLLHMVFCKVWAKASREERIEAIHAALDAGIL